MGELKNCLLPTPVHMRAHLKEFIETMSSTNLIRGSRAPFSAEPPVLVIPKPKNPNRSSCGFWLVMDCRALNEIDELIHHHIPNVHAMHEKLRNAKYISTLDLRTDIGIYGGVTKESKSLTSPMWAPAHSK